MPAGIPGCAPRGAAAKWWGELLHGPPERGRAVNFDGPRRVTFSQTTNTNKAFGTAQTLSGTYTLQANCVGVVTINSGDTATLTLSASNLGKAYMVTGQDGVYAFTGRGSVLPATCPTALTAG